MLRKSLSISAAAVVALSIFGCSTADSPTSPIVAAPSGTSNALLGSLTSTVTGLLANLLVTCDRLPAQSVSQVVGRNGGRINVGPHSIVIPAGALPANVRITAQILGDDVSSVRFSPQGLRFAKPATLNLSYSHCRKLLPLPTQIVYTTDNLRILELLRSQDDRVAKRVSAPLDHFSRYAVAYRNSSSDDDAGDGLARDSGGGGNSDTE